MIVQDFPEVFWKPDLFLGCERKLFISASTLSFTLILMSWSITGITYGVMLWLLTLCTLRYVAKIDPMMSLIYLRSLKYRPYYPSHARPFYYNSRS